MVILIIWKIIYLEIFQILFFISACCYAADGANILAIYIFPAYSHQMPLLRLSKALAARGHNLTVITANPSKVRQLVYNDDKLTWIDSSFIVWYYEHLYCAGTDSQPHRDRYVLLLWNATQRTVRFQYKHEDRCI